MTGLSPAQLATLQDTYHIYMLPMGRLSFTGCEYRCQINYILSLLLD